MIKAAIAWCFLIVLMFFSFPVLARTSIVDSKHNLSASGPGEVKALTEDRICVFCHTPHNATPMTPLWNRQINEGVNYDTYDSTTFNVTLSQPSGPSRLCLSCHDGTVGIGAVLSVAGGIKMRKELTGRPSLLGTDLTNDHPFSFAYSDAQPLNPELVPTAPADLQLYNGDAVHCSTCHDAHDDTFGMFLAVDNRGSLLCLKCHNVEGWELSSHATSTNTWSGSGKNPWPLNARIKLSAQRHSVADNGCENCHLPHNAMGPQRLLTHLEEENVCVSACHNGQVSNPGKNISLQLNKFYSHPVSQTTIGDISGVFHDPAEDVSNISGHVECQDCHDQHSVNSSTASAPFVSGNLVNVSGIDENGNVVNPATYEYEICFKCHADSNTDVITVSRYINSLNTRLDFSINNPSFHPVVGIGRNANVPSLPSTTSLDQTMSEASLIYCTDCHSSDGTSKAGGVGPNGPHGSIYEAILRENYEMVVGTQESYAAYALCYRCHDRTNLLMDVSFQKKTLTAKGGHSGHLAAGTGTPCSVCHDPHGIVDDNVSGDHTHLINFDNTVVLPDTGQSVPLFSDNGSNSGSCTLICHGVRHTNYTYP